MKEVLGNTDGLKNNIIESLLQLYELKVPPWQLVSEEIVIHMAKITTAVNREVNIFLDRKGNVLSVSIGDSNTVSLPNYSFIAKPAGPEGNRAIERDPLYSYTPWGESAIKRN